MKQLPHLFLPFFAFLLSAQDSSVTIRIRLVDGRTGNVVRSEKIGLQDGSDYRDISVRTNLQGVAFLKTRRDAVILVHNTDRYVNCEDEHGGLMHNDFRVARIVASGIAQAIPQPNLCGKVSATASQGELILFVRPWRLLESTPL